MRQIISTQKILQESYETLGWVGLELKSVKFDSDWVLPTGFVLDFKSVKFHGFGFGFDMAHGSGWISNRYYLTESCAACPKDQHTHMTNNRF